MEKRRKVLSFTVLIILSLLLIGCSQSAEDIVENFEDAILEKDSEGLFELVTVGENVYWTEQQAEQTISYFSENPKEFSAQLTMLKEQAMALEEDRPFSNDEGLFYFFDDDELYVRSYDLFLSSNSMSKQGFRQATVLMQKEETVFDEITEEMFIRTVGPGTYEFMIDIDYDYSNVSHDKIVELYNARSFERSIFVEAEGMFVHLLNAYPETVLYIDDEQVDEQIFNEKTEGGFHGNYKLHPLKIGPLDEGLTLRSTLELPWDQVTLESESYTFEKDDGYYTDPLVVNEFDMTPKILSDEDIQDELLELVVDYYEKLFEALIENDKSHLDDALATEQVIRDLDGHFSKIGGSLSSFYAGDLDEVTMDFSDIVLTDDGLPIIKTYLYTNFQYFVTKHSLDIDGDKMKHLFRRLTFDQIDDKWTIVEEEGDFYGSGNPNLDKDHVKTIKVK